MILAVLFVFKQILFESLIEIENKKYIPSKVFAYYFIILCKLTFSLFHNKITLLSLLIPFKSPIVNLFL